MGLVRVCVPSVDVDFLVSIARERIIDSAVYIGADTPPPR